MCVGVLVCVCVCFLTHCGRRGQFLFVSWVSLLMSCNIKLEVSERSQLSVILVVLACRAAHLCLLDKTSCALPRENTSLRSLYFSLPFFFTMFLSSSVNLFVCPSRFSSLNSKTFWFSYYLLFFKVIILPSYSFVSFFFSPRLLLFSFSLTLLSIFSLYYYFFFGLHCSLV